MHKRDYALSLSVPKSRAENGGGRGVKTIGSGYPAHSPVWHRATAGQTDTPSFTKGTKARKPGSTWPSNQAAPRPWHDAAFLPHRPQSPGEDCILIKQDPKREACGGKKMDAHVCSDRESVKTMQEEVARSDKKMKKKTAFEP